MKYPIEKNNGIFTWEMSYSKKFCQKEKSADIVKRK